MSRTMPSAPWVAKAIEQFLEMPGQDSFRDGPPNKDPRTCQVLRVHDDMKCLVISDGHNSIAVFLTHDCYRDVQLQTGQGEKISCLEHCLVKITKYHFSSIVQCASNRDLNKIIQLRLSLPFAIQCSKLTHLGLAEVSTIGDPKDVNKEMLPRCPSHGIIMKNILSKQFPNEHFLPNPGI